MRAPLSWLREYADLPDVPASEIAAALIRAGFEVEGVDSYGADVSGVVVGQVLEVEELSGFKKPIRYCALDFGGARSFVVCGASNFVAGDKVAVAVPGSTLPMGEISARKTYGRTSEGMICSSRELGLGNEHEGILVLPADAPLGADVAGYLRLRDQVLDVAVTPDRGYAFSIRGLAREAATAFGVPFRDPAERTGTGPASSASTASTASTGPAQAVRVQAPDGCDRYVAQLVTGVDPSAPTPMEMQRRLLLAGMRPISLAVDVTNYVLLELGQPLHAFDRQKLAGAITVRRARAGERLPTLDGVDRELHPEDLLIADDAGPLALAGVMGGASSEVGAGTTDVVLESAHFHPVTVARTSRRHRLSSEASRRFERGVDPALPVLAAQIAADLLIRFGGGTAAGSTDVGAAPEVASIAFPVALAGRIAGRDVQADTVTRRLTEVGCTVAEGSAESLPVTPPSWRPDLREPVDLVEEVLRLEGFDTIPSVLPQAPAGRGLTQEQRLRRQLSRTVAAAGYTEVLTMPFLSDDVWDAFGLEPDDARRRTVRLANPLAGTEASLRSCLLPGLLQALKLNVGRGHPDVALFEMGLVFRSGSEPVRAPSLPVTRRPAAEQLALLDAALPEQPRRLAAVLAGVREQAGWWGQSRDATWADAVELARSVATAISVPVDLSADRHAPWHPGRCARIGASGRLIGHAGELHPRTVAALGLPARTCAVELDVDVLLAAAPEAVRGPAVSAYPVATADVALVVDEQLPAASVQTALQDGAGPLLESVRLFDVYAGEQVGAGRRSLAFALRFRAPDRTLTAEEIAAARDAAVAAAAERTGAVLRGG